MKKSVSIIATNLDYDWAGRIEKWLTDHGVSPVVGMTAGKTLARHSRESSETDRMIVVCSESTFMAMGNPIAYAISLVLKREAEQPGDSYLIPVVVSGFNLREASYKIGYGDSRSILGDRVPVYLNEGFLFEKSMCHLLKALS